MHYKIVIRKNAILTFIFVLFLSDLESIDYSGSELLAILNTCVRLFAGICILLLYFKRHGSNIPTFVLLVIVLQVWLMLSTILNEGNWWGCTVRAVTCISIVMLFENMIGHERDFIRGFMLVSEVGCYANLMTVLLYPDGMYRNVKSAYAWSTQLNWLLGNKNNFTPYLLVFCVVAFIYRSYGGSIIREWGIYIGSFVSVLLAASSTSIIGFALLLIALLVVRYTNVRFNGYVLLAVYVVIYLLCVVWRVQDIFSLIIEQILHKKLSFSGRTFLWDKVFPIIAQKPIIGYGIRPSGFLNNLTGFSWAMHTHNLVLQYIFEGGFVYLGLYLVMVLFIFKRLKKETEYKNTQAIIVVLFLFYVMAMMEPYNKPFVYFLYAFAYYANIFNEEKQIKCTKMPENA